MDQKDNILEKNDNSFGDFATLISICGIALYSLGWIYWNFFFKNLGISMSFFDLSFDKVIITTWPFIVFSTLGFFPTFLHISGDKEDSWDIVTVIFIVTNAILFSLASLLKYNFFLWIFLSTFIIYATIQITVRKKKIPIRYITIKAIRYVVVVAIYIFALFFYGYSGRKNAQDIIKNYQENCEVTLKDRGVISGNLVIHSAEKTFLLFENEDCKKQIIIINDAEILKITSKVDSTTANSLLAQ